MSAKKKKEQGKHLFTCRLLIHPCMGVAGHYRPNYLKFLSVAGMYQVVPPSRQLQTTGRVCYYWELVVHNWPDYPNSFSGFSVKSNWNYLTQAKCEKVAREVAKQMQLKIMHTIKPKAWSKSAIAKDAAEERARKRERKR